MSLKCDHGWMIELRLATAADTEFLGEMLALAAEWRVIRPTRSVVDVMADTHLARYVVDWPRQGEIGVVALDHGRAIGAAWWRLFDDHHHGYGYLDAGTPEISLAVVADARRHGAGRMLLERLIDEARSSSARRLSLSVETDNPAIGLYEQVGFHVVAAAAGAVTMVCEIVEREFGVTPLH